MRLGLLRSTLMRIPRNCPMKITDTINKVLKHKAFNKTLAASPEQNGLRDSASDGKMP